MGTVKAGDWVRTKEGPRGTILLVARQTAFIEIEGHDETRTRPFLLSELTRVDPPRKSDKLFRPCSAAIIEEAVDIGDRH
jgi:hypothetical protein